MIRKGSLTGGFDMLYLKHSRFWLKNPQSINCVPLAPIVVLRYFSTCCCFLFPLFASVLFPFLFPFLLAACSAPARPICSRSFKSPKSLISLKSPKSSKSFKSLKLFEARWRGPLVRFERRLVSSSAAAGCRFFFCRVLHS